MNMFEDWPSSQGLERSEISVDCRGDLQIGQLWICMETADQDRWLFLWEIKIRMTKEVDKFMRVSDIYQEKPLDKYLSRTQQNLVEDQLV